MVVPESSEHLEPLDRDECVRRLEAHGLGRIGAIVAGRPVVYPINYTIFEDAILFRTRRGGEIDSVPEGQLMALEIDGTDYLYHEGWSVLVVGPCSPVNGAATNEQLRHVHLSPWADQKRDRYVRIPLQMVSGRRISHEMTGPAWCGPKQHP